MQEALVLLSRKGGNGKTSTVSALTAGFISKNYRVLVIDLDGQGSISHVMGADPNGPSILDAMLGKIDIKQAIQHTAAGDIIGANDGLEDAEDLVHGSGREFQLRTVLQPIRESYDLILFDTVPLFEVLTLNSIACATGVILPTQVDVLSLKALRKTHELISSAKRSVNPNLNLYGILLTRFFQRSILSRDLLLAFEQAAVQMGTQIFRAKIRESVTIREAQAQQADIFSYAPKSNAANDCQLFVDELEAILRG